SLVRARTRHLPAPSMAARGPAPPAPTITASKLWWWTFTCLILARGPFSPHIPRTLCVPPELAGGNAQGSGSSGDDHGLVAVGGRHVAGGQREVEDDLAGH